MSTVLHRREFNIAITAEESAKELVETTADIQASFFEMMAQEIDNWPTRLKRQSPSWPMQCRYIADEMDEGQRRAVANMLDTLIEHLREVRECVPAVDAAG